MSDYSTYPRQDAYKTQLTQGISDSDTVCPVLVAPSVTVTAPDKIYIGIDYDNGSYELCKATIAAGVITLTDRAQAIYEGGTGTARSHASGAKVIISHTWKTFADIATAIATKLDKSGGTMTGALEFSGTTHGGVRLINLTTAQINALGAVANGYKVYDTTTGEVKTRIGGAWVVEAAGGAFPNADTATAGKMEVNTQAESDAGTAIGGTGASLATTPATVAASIQKGAWLYAASASGNDTYAANLTPALGAYADGNLVYLVPDTANTGACTLNLNGLGAINIKMLDGTDPADGVIAANKPTLLFYKSAVFYVLSSSAVQAISKSTLTAKGSIISASAASTPVELVVGTNGYGLYADSTTASGLKWAPVSTSGTIADNNNITVSSGAGTNTDTVVAHGLGRTPNLIRVSATVRANGATNAIILYGIAEWASSSATPKFVYATAIGTGSTGIPLTGAQDFTISGNGGQRDVITISIISVDATNFTFRINGAYVSADAAGNSTLTSCSWVAL